MDKKFFDSGLVSGHGSNWDTWPMSGETSLPITWIHEKLKTKKPRLSIVQYDCCNFRSNVVQKANDSPPKSLNFKLLFLESKGHIISASASSVQNSFGFTNIGSVYTNMFYDAIRECYK